MADPDVWLRTAIKEKDGFKYLEYVLCYVDDVFCISNKPAHTMGGVQTKFKLKNDKIDKPEVYLGTELSSMDNEQGIECWAIV